MTSQTTFMPQRPTRIPVDISVHITSVLDSGEAVLRDMTEYGALIEGLSLPGIAEVKERWSSDCAKLRPLSGFVTKSQRSSRS